MPLTGFEVLSTGSKSIQNLDPRAIPTILSIGFEVLSTEFEILATELQIPQKPMKHKDWNLKFCQICSSVMTQTVQI